MPPLVPPTPHRPLGNASELVPHDLRECDSLAARRSRPGSAANCVARRLTGRSPVFSLPGTCNAARARPAAVVVVGGDVSGVAACMCPAASPALPSVASVASERERRGHLSPLARTGDRTRAQAARRHGGTAARRHARARAERRAFRLAAQRISRAGGAAVQPNPNPHSVLGEARRRSERDGEKAPRPPARPRLVVDRA